MEDFIEPEGIEPVVLPENQVKVNSDIVKIMNMPRKARRIIGRRYGYKIIPSIVNVQVKKLSNPSFVEPNQEAPL